MIVWLALLVIFFLVMSTEYFSWRTGVPTVASFRPTRSKIIDALKARAAAHKGSAPFSIIDLGSGHGQLAAQIARALPDAEVTGIEISFVAWAIACLRKIIFGPKNMTFKCIDFWPYDCSKADAIVLFLTPNVIDRISQKLLAELKPGAIVVSNECALSGGWEPVEIIDTGLYKVQIFVYRQGHHAPKN